MAEGEPNDASIKDLNLKELAITNSDHNGNDQLDGVPLSVASEQQEGRKKKKKNKKKNKQKEEEQNIDVVPYATSSASVPSTSNNTVKSMKDISKVFLSEEMRNAAAAQIGTKKRWQFWNTQPVPALEENVETTGKIEEDKEHVKTDTYSLPAGFEWDTLDLGNKTELEELYELLNENYVEDEDNMFRFDYSPDFLRWALRPPDWERDWHCGVRVIKSKKLVGFISAIPANIKVHAEVIKMVEINFLCVHKKLRSKRVAPVLIKEITRRVNMKGVFQAAYTAGVVLPKPVGVCRYYHRSLNPKKLVSVKFSHLGRNQTMTRLIKLMKLPENSLTVGLRPMEGKDVPECHKLLDDKLKKFDLAIRFTEEEFRHFFIPRPGIIETYVVENEGRVTDMVSFFSLPSSIMHNADYDKLNAAYSYYNVCTKTPIVDLMRDLLIIAKQKGYDVFNALDLMDNKKFLKELKFGMGDGNLHFYLYNYKCPTIPCEKMALVLQ